METNLATNFWNRTLNKDSSLTINSTWDQEVMFLYALGISMEHALQFLYSNQPNLAEFEKWIDSNTLQICNDESCIDDVFTQNDIEFWNRNGFIVLKNAITKEDCENTRNAIWEFLHKSINDEHSWYIQHPRQSGMMVQFSDHPTLNANRNSPRIRKAFEQLYQSLDLYKTIDKVSFNPPITKNYSFMGSALHWDVSLKLPIPFKLQGLIYLSDCDENDGCFQCVPGFHNQIDAWLNQLPSADNPREIALKILKPISIIGKAGDVVIWNQALPHCASPNYGNSPRMVQYVTYFPNDCKSADEWI